VAHRKRVKITRLAGKKNPTSMGGLKHGEGEV